jgi:hypothetical protein
MDYRKNASGFASFAISIPCVGHSILCLWKGKVRSGGVTELSSPEFENDDDCMMAIHTKFTQQ